MGRVDGWRVGVSVKERKTGSISCGVFVLVCTISLKIPRSMMMSKYGIIVEFREPSRRASQGYYLKTLPSKWNDKMCGFGHGCVAQGTLFPASKVTDTEISVVRRRVSGQ